MVICRCKTDTHAQCVTCDEPGASRAWLMPFQELESTVNNVHLPCSHLASHAVRDGTNLLSKRQNSFSCMFPLLQVFIIHDFVVRPVLIVFHFTNHPPIRCSSLYPLSQIINRQISRRSSCQCSSLDTSSLETLLAWLARCSRCVHQHIYSEHVVETSAILQSSQPVSPLLPPPAGRPAGSTAAQPLPPRHPDPPQWCCQSQGDNPQP